MLSSSSSPLCSSASDPDSLFDVLPSSARSLLQEAFSGFSDSDTLVDIHTHCCGLGKDDSGCFVHPRMVSPVCSSSNLISPSGLYQALKFRVFMRAAGVSADDAHADVSYLRRLVHLIRGVKASREARGQYRCVLLAFDCCYDEDGKLDVSQSGMHCPNEWMWKAVQDYPDCFIPAISIHPYRNDALSELARWASKGVRIVKWLPNSMNINLRHWKCQAFYAALKKHQMILLTHTGREISVDAGHHDDSQGNPLHLIAPLDAGVITIAAHCASDGHYPALHDKHTNQQQTKEAPQYKKKDDKEEATETDVEQKRRKLLSADTDKSDQKAGDVELPQSFENVSDDTLDLDCFCSHPPALNSSFSSSVCPSLRLCPSLVDHSHAFDLFVHLLTLPKYSSLLFGDLSALVTVRRCFTLPLLLSQPWLHGRLLQGSDYPVPAVSFVVWIKKLHRIGVIENDQKRKDLELIYSYNPLLFDFVVKRMMRGGKGEKLPEAVFTMKNLPVPIFVRSAAAAQQL